jgi:hypothetical protein
MTVKRIGAIVLIYIVVAVAWAILGASNEYRSSQTYSRLEGGDGGDSSSMSGRSSVADLWGEPQTQRAPLVWTTHMEKTSTKNDKGKLIVQEIQQSDPIILAGSRIVTDIKLEPRRKGLLWYSTYKVSFAGDYTFKNEYPTAKKFFVKFTFPVEQAIYDNVSLMVNDKPITPSGAGVQSDVKLEPGQTARLHMAYASQGLDSWRYRFSDEGGVSNVRQFQADVHMNCSDFDFPAKCISPTEKTQDGKGWNLTWKYSSLVSGFDIGIQMPKKLNPGPLAARLSFFAPVSLFFFFAVFIILGAVKGVRLHPMHYVFLAASFFSFHLLFSYMVDHVTLIPSFIIASVVSLLLTISYVRLVIDWKFAILQAGLWQFVFLVLFAYAFFFEGYTGLTITIGSILTLAVLMQMTGRVDWEQKLSGNPDPTSTGG